MRRITCSIKKSARATLMKNLSLVQWVLRRCTFCMLIHYKGTLSAPSRAPCQSPRWNSKRLTKNVSVEFQSNWNQAQLHRENANAKIVRNNVTKGCIVFHLCINAFAALFVANCSDALGEGSFLPFSLRGAIDLATVGEVNNGLQPPPPGPCTP